MEPDGDEDVDGPWRRHDADSAGGSMLRRGFIGFLLSLGLLRILISPVKVYEGIRVEDVG